MRKVSPCAKRETRALIPTASPKPSVFRAVDDEPNHLARKWLDVVHVGNSVRRILLARGPATAYAFSTRPPHAPHVISGARDALSSSYVDVASSYG